jgi:hypothetical protein
MKIRFASVLCLCATAAYAQKRNGDRTPMDRAAEIALARTAAPAPVSRDARVWVWTGSRYTIADSGRSAVNCYVGRPWDVALEPHCFDEEGSRTIFPIQRRRVELYAAGKREAEVEREIADGIANGTLPLPARAALTYMMSGAQQLVNGQGAPVGAWRPHLMVYIPYLTAEASGLPSFVPDVGFVENPGTAFAAVVIPLKEFVVADSAKKKP